MLLLILLCLHTSNTESLNESYIQKYLTTYGYINKSAHDLSLLQNNSNIVQDGLLRFQDFFDFPLDGVMNKEMEKLMLTPRCGLPDTPMLYTLASAKWQKLKLNWYFSNHFVGPEFEDAQRAFDVWSKNSPLQFTHSVRNADIIISFSSKNHKYVKSRAKCNTDFDGRGNNLAHAFTPTISNTPLEIHLDKEESWYNGVSDDTTKEKISLFSVLVHEIGHTLGLMHSTDPNSIMFPTYRNNGTLNQDDISGINKLYGVIQQTNSTLKTTETTIKPSPTTTVASNKTMENTIKPSPTVTFSTTPISMGYEGVHICTADKNFRGFVVIDSNLYVFFKNMVWTIDLKDNNYSKKSILITDWLPFLKPYLFANSTYFAYQRPNGNLGILIDNRLFIVDVHSFELTQNPYNLKNLRLPNVRKVNGIVNSHKGKTYIFHDDFYYAVLDECRLSCVKFGRISDLFPNIPNNIDGVSRYINGDLYFFHGMTVTTYNEFTLKVVSTHEKSLSILNIDCPDEGILQQLKKLISKIMAADIHIPANY